MAYTSRLRDLGSPWSLDTLRKINKLTARVEQNGTNSAKCPAYRTFYCEAGHCRFLSDILCSVQVLVLQ